MIVKTKKTKLEPSKYISVSFFRAIKEFWWAWFVPVAMLIIGAIFTAAFWWMFWIALVLSILYVLFWYAQFAGAAQVEQNKVLFERVNYEISSQHILIKLNVKEGMPIGWNMIKDVEKGKDHFLFIIARGQFIYLPFSIFKSDGDIRFVETILKRKKLMPA